MRLATILLASFALAMVGFAARERQVGRALDESELAATRGGTGTQKGSGTYDCSDAEAGNGTISSNTCATTPNNQIGASGIPAVQCDDVGSGLYEDANGNAITFNNVVQCEGQKNLGTCIRGAGDFGFYQTGLGGPYGNCGGSYDRWLTQTIVTPPGGGD